MNSDKPGCWCLPTTPQLTIGVSVKMFMPGPTGMAHDTTGFMTLPTSTRHMRQLPEEKMGATKGRQ